MIKYDSETALQRLETLSGWALINDSIEKKYTFKDFREAISFMVRVSFICEEMNHHPNWANVYNRLMIRLSTHDAGGLTDKDFKLAEAIDSLLK